MNPKGTSSPLPPATVPLASFLLLADRPRTAQVVRAVEAAESSLSEGTESPDARYPLEGLHCLVPLQFEHPPQLNEVSVTGLVLGARRMCCRASLIAPFIQSTPVGSAAWLTGCISQKGCVLKKRHCTKLSPAARPNTSARRKAITDILRVSHCCPQGGGRRRWERVRYHRAEPRSVGGLCSRWEKEHALLLCDGGTHSSFQALFLILGRESCRKNDQW